MSRRALVVALVLAFGLPLTGCGKKGPLEPPPEREVPKERQVT